MNALTRSLRPTVWVLPAVTVGCSAPPKGFTSPDPGSRLRAAVAAVGASDERSVRYLIDMLESDDPAERMIAIRALEALTGQTLGYDHAAPEWERRAAVERWIEWYRASPAGGAYASGDGTGP